MTAKKKKRKKSTYQNLKYLDGTAFCIVCMTVLDMETQKVKLAPFHGVAKVLSDRLVLEEPSGNQHVVPESSLASITPSDGTELLGDAEHYVIVKIGEQG